MDKNEEKTGKKRDLKVEMGGNRLKMRGNWVKSGKNLENWEKIGGKYLQINEGK